MSAAGQERETLNKAVSMMPNNVGDESVIIISDVDDFNQSSNDLSTRSDADDSIIVTFSKKAEVLPHARSDCTSNIFRPAENELSCPLSMNSAFCEQCYCYVCDGLASQCKYWTTLGIFHCNAHNKSSFWKKARNVASNGGILAMFNLNPELIDADIKNAGKLLETFLMILKPLYCQYFIGTREPGNACTCTCHDGEASNLPVSPCQFCNLHHLTVKEHFYQPVFSAVESFLNVLGSLGPSGQLLAMLGVAKEIMLHTEMPMTSSCVGSSWKNLLKPAVVHLMEMIQLKARMIQVEHKLPPALLKGLKIFFSGLFFPIHCLRFLNSMFIIGWDEPMISSVMRGQNISGIFYIKGKRQLLHEDFDVVVARKNKLVQEEKYQELIRYLKVVLTHNMNGLHKLQYEIPVYLCKINKMFDALRWMASSPKCTSNLPPTVIKTMIVNASELIHDTAAPASREKASLFLSLALRIIFLNEELKNDIHSLVMLVKLLCTPPTPAGTQCAHIQALGCPPPELFEMSHAIEGLNEGNTHIPSIPNTFSSLAGCVIIATHVIVQNFSLQLLRPDNFWNLLLAYGPNMWAVEFLLSSIRHCLKWTFVDDMKNFAYREGIVERLAVQHRQQICALTDLFRKVDHAEFNHLGIYFSSLLFFFIMTNASTEPEKENVKKWMVSTVIPTLVRLNTQESIELQKAVWHFLNQPS
ncbi:uncharacterized protein LOC133347711 isoform X2 [Lethenteron reissneri]|uniref:uncharacterized protein LOC133347711 isoform X2 n=1 Tax=Lethenteron reissneri TaxID=7753 RepID=UPI002AB6B316|nr:uncharacterized protein LOC133347711 isoform X2 [Lethenteron reissneri]